MFLSFEIHLVHTTGGSLGASQEEGFLLSEWSRRSGSFTPDSYFIERQTYWARCSDVGGKARSQGGWRPVGLDS